MQAESPPFLREEEKRPKGNARQTQKGSPTHVEIGNEAPGGYSLCFFGHPQSKVVEKRGLFLPGQLRSGPPRPRCR
ncbi:hypothetical protein GN956_G13310 [Arapaima gigas]